MTVLKSELILSLIDRVTAPARSVARAVATLQDRLSQNTVRMEAMRGRMLETAAAGYGLYQALSRPIRAAGEFGSMLEDIGQKASIPQERLAAIGEEIRAIGIQTGQGATAIGKSVDFLMGMGADQKSALTLADPIGKAATAYRAATEELAAATFAVTDNLKVPADQAAFALDIMAAAGKEGGFELRDMAKEFPVITAAAQALGIKGTKGVADLVAMLEVARKGAGSGSEAATNLSNFLAKITSKETIGNFKKFGINVTKELQRAEKAGVSPVEHMLGVIDKATKGGRSDLLNQLFGDMQVQQFIRPMLANMEEYRRIRESALKASGTVQGDFDRRMKTYGGATMRFQAQMENLAIVIGSTLLPAISDVVDRVAPLMEQLARFAEANPQLVASIVGLAAALVGLRVAAFGLQFAFFWMRAGYLKSALKGLVALRGGAKALGLALAAMGRRSQLAGKASLAGFSMIDQATAKSAAAKAASQRMIQGMSGAKDLAASSAMIAGMSAAGRSLVPAATGIVASLSGIFTAFVGFLGGISAPVWGAVAVIGLAVAGIGATIYRYWEPISNFIAGFAGKIGEEIGKVVSMITEAGGRIASAVGSWAVQKVVDIAGWLGIDEATVRAAFDQTLAAVVAGGARIIEVVKAIPSQVGNWVSELFAMKDYSEADEANFHDLGARMAGKLIDGIKSAASGIASVFAGLFTGVAIPLPDFTQITESFRSLGSQLVGSLVDGITSSASIVSNAFATLFGNLSIPTPDFSAVSGAFATLASSISNAVDRIAGAVNRAKAALGSLGSVGAFGSTPVAAGTFHKNPLQAYMPSDVPAAQVPARAAGGPVKRGVATLVGELGPELVTFPASGMVHDARKTAAMLGGRDRGYATSAASGSGQGAGRSGSASVTFGNIIIQGGAGASARELRAEFGREAARMARSQFSDGGT